NSDGTNYFALLPEERKTEAVSLAAVTANGGNLEYVPDHVLTPEICRAALNTGDSDVSMLSQIPFPEVQKEGAQKFIASGNAPFVVYSFTDIQDARMAKEAVKADAYCLQFVPDRLITADLCKTALQSPNADKKVLGFIPERFRTSEIRKMAEDKFGEKVVRQKELSPPPHKKGIGL
ncbi:MAG: DUF4116 domain-containing protein, partial [Prevotellaceae bacterium]|nr:DUF4116 domain-containing protein [Prevotellaceae bacterium]